MIFLNILKGFGILLFLVHLFRYEVYEGFRAKLIWNTYESSHAMWDYRGNT